MHSSVQKWKLIKCTTIRSNPVKASSTLEYLSGKNERNIIKFIKFEQQTLNIKMRAPKTCVEWIYLNLAMLEYKVSYKTSILDVMEG